MKRLLVNVGWGAVGGLLGLVVLLGSALAVPGCATDPKTGQQMVDPVQLGRTLDTIIKLVDAFSGAPATPAQVRAVDAFLTETYGDGYIQHAQQRWNQTHPAPPSGASVHDPVAAWRARVLSARS